MSHAVFCFFSSSFTGTTSEKQKKKTQNQFFFNSQTNESRVDPPISPPKEYHPTQSQKNKLSSSRIINESQKMWRYNFFWNIIEKSRGQVSCLRGEETKLNEQAATIDQCSQQSQKLLLAAGPHIF